MGEYDRNGRKMGTCELMYYLHLSDARDTLPSVDSFGNETSCNPWRERENLWFRLPFGEDRNTPVEHMFPVNVPADMTDGHGIVQVRSESGLMLNVQCVPATRNPQGLGRPQELAPGVRVFRNGGTGGYDLRMMGVRNGKRAVLVRCRDCGNPWRIEDGPDGELAAVLDALPKHLRVAMDREWKAAGV